MDTVSKRLKDTIRSAMQEDRTYSNEAIRQMIYGKTGMKYGTDYKETHFAGCLNALKRSGEIIQVQRGEYKKGRTGAQAQEGPQQQDFSESVSGEVSTDQVKEDILLSVRQELTYLRSITQNMVFSFDAPREDIEYMLKLKELIRALEEFQQQIDA